MSDSTSDPLTLLSPPHTLSTCLNIPVATILVFLCQALSNTPSPLFTFNTQANHDAASENTGQSQCRFYQNTTILQVCVKPGQLVAVH